MLDGESLRLHVAGPDAAAGLSDTGFQREINEDSFAVRPDLGLYIVADGMGGRDCGEVASRLAVEVIARFIGSRGGEGVAMDRAGSTDEGALLAAAIGQANREILEEGLRARERFGLGSTVVAALYAARDRRLHIGHVGDSRAYCIRGGGINQLTRDHSLINSNPPVPLTDEEIEQLSTGTITRAIGIRDRVKVDLITLDPQPGDAYLLCSDGLSGMLRDQDILAVMSATRDPAEMCQRLIDAANEQGGEDNITAVVILFGSNGR